MKAPLPGATIDVSMRGPDVVPLYHRIYVVLRQKVTDGSFPSGESMPSEDELAVSFGVSRVTIRKAMERLEREGLVLRQRGRGTYPQLPALAPGEVGTQLLSNQISLGRKTSVDVLSYEIVRLPPQLSKAFGQIAGTDVLRIIRVRRDPRSPISHTVCYIAADLAGLLPRDAITSLPISATLAAAGVQLTHFQEWITATLADSDVARHLSIDVGTALIAMTRHVRDENGRLMELLQALYRPDRYEYRVEYSSAQQDSGMRWKAMITDNSN